MDISYILELLEACGLWGPKNAFLEVENMPGNQVLPDGGWIDWPRFPSMAVVHYSLCLKIIFYVSNFGEIKVLLPIDHVVW
jgi:hypothetical protein